ncbi:MAG: APC family permease [Candidatus Heimdallarchaeaceae archaeon]|jgi:amino acid transporter
MSSDKENNGSSDIVELSKELGLKEALGIAIGALIGGGVFSVLGIVIADTGPGAFLAFLLAGIVSAFTAYSYVHLALKHPRAGGAFIYVREAFKSKALSGILGIILWFGYSFSVSLYAMTFGRYLGEVWKIFGDRTLNLLFYQVSASAFFFQILSVVLFIGLNLLGVKESSRTQNILVLVKISILLLYIIVGIFAVKGENFTDPFFIKDGFSLIASSVLIFVSMEGFEILSNSVEEMKNPKKDLPIGMYFSIIVVLIIYVSVAIVTVGVLGWSSGLESDGEVILTLSASVFLGSAGKWIMAIAAIVSAASAINATLLGSSRLSYMLSHEKVIPVAISKISPKTRVPARAITLSGIISMIFVAVFDIRIVATIASIIFMGIFGAVNISAIKLLEGKKRIPSAIGAVLLILYWCFWFWFQFR